MNNLSPRMKLLAELVLPGKPAADIGTDHGFVPIALLADNIVPFVILTDVNEGPLGIAKTHLEEVQLKPELYSLRLGSGLEPIDSGEVSSIIIAGMGGELIESILAADSEKSHSFERLILQPRTHANTLRYYLSTHGFKYADYRLVKEKGRICEIIVAKPCKEGEAVPDTQLVSEFLLQKKDPLLAEFVEYKLKSAAAILSSLRAAKAEESAELLATWQAIHKDLVEIKERIANEY